MKRLTLIVLGWMVVWSTQEAVEMSASQIMLYGYSNQCHIETVEHEKKFDDEMEALSEMSSLKADGITNAKLYELREKK